MLWVTAFLALIIWLLGLASGFLGFRIHIFLLAAILCVLIALLPSSTSPDDEAEDEDAPPVDPHAKSVPAADDDPAPTPRDITALR